MRTRATSRRIAVGAVALAAILASCGGGGEPFSFDPNTPTSVAQGGTDQDDVLLWATPLEGGGYFASGSTVGQLAAEPAGGKDAYVLLVEDGTGFVFEDQFGVEGDDAALGNTIGPDGTFYAAGYTNGDIAAPNQGSADIWLRAYSPGGDVLWTTQAGGPKWDRAYSVIAHETHIFVTGYTFGELADVEQGGADAFVARFAKDGTLEWINQYGTAALEWGQAGTAGPDGSLYLVGFTEGDVAAPNAGERDAFLMHIAADGSVVASAQIGSAGTDWATAAVAGDEEIVIVGHTAGQLTGNHLGEADGFVQAFDLNLNPTWGVQFGSPVIDQAYGIAPVSGGYVVSGYTLGTVGDRSAGGRDAMVAFVADDGESITVGQFGSDADDEAYGIATQDDALVIVGYSTGSLGSSHLGGTDLIEVGWGPSDGNE